MCVRFAGDEERLATKAVGCANGLGSVMGAPARVSRAEPSALGRAVHVFPVQSCEGVSLLGRYSIRGRKIWGLRGVRNPKYGVLLGAAGRFIGRRGWRLECARISNVKRYLRAEGDRKGL